MNKEIITAVYSCLFVSLKVNSLFGNGRLGLFGSNLQEQTCPNIPVFLKVGRRSPRGALKGCWGVAMQQGGAGGGARGFYKAKQRYNLMSEQRYHIPKY